MGSATTDTPQTPTPPHVSAALRDRVAHLIARAHFFTRDYANRILEPLGLATRHYAALAMLDAEGPISQQALGELIACDRTTMVELMDALEDKGLTKRSRNPLDRRAYAIELTDAGRRALAEAAARMDEAETVLLEPLSAAEREQLRELLLRLLRQ